MCKEIVVVELPSGKKVIQDCFMKPLIQPEMGAKAYLDVIFIINLDEFKRTWVETKEGWICPECRNKLAEGGGDE